MDLKQLLFGGGAKASAAEPFRDSIQAWLPIKSIVGGVVVLALAAALAFQLRKTDGKLGSLRVLPPESNYFMTWLTCAVTSAVMVLALVLGISASQYLLYVLAGWLFAQAVYFTVKMM